MDVEEAIRHRRTVKRFSGAPVAREDVEALLDLAVWAPNHRLTEPWRFVAVHAAAARERLADAVDQGYAALAKPGTAEDDPGAARLTRKRDDMRARIVAAGAVIIVTAVVDPEDATITEENYAATCCAIHNVLLAATARGIASYWSTGRPLHGEAARALLGLAADARFCGAIFLGRAEGEGRREGRRTPAATFTRWID